MMEKDEIAVKFKIIKDQYHRLGNNIVDALKTFLDEKGVSYVDVYFRVKGFDSFYEKIDRKKYENPFDDMEDVCGVRVICYYHSDIKKIDEVIKKEFEIVESQDKSELLGLKEFAYRSQHYVVKINNKWLSAPNYRRLNDRKAEIQVRTILMHAWAEIEHKLNYKSDAQVPESFQRRLFRLSAKLEEADEQFVELKDGIELYRQELEDKLIQRNSFDLSQSLNLESYIVFVKYCFPEFKESNFGYLDKSFEQASEKYTDFTVMYSAFKNIEGYIDQIAADLLASGYHDIRINPNEILSMAYDISDISNGLLENKVESWRSVALKWRAALSET